MGRAGSSWRPFPPRIQRRIQPGRPPKRQRSPPRPSGTQRRRGPGAARPPGAGTSPPRCPRPRGRLGLLRSARPRSGSPPLPALAHLAVSASALRPEPPAPQPRLRLRPRRRPPGPLTPPGRAPRPASGPPPWPAPGLAGLWAGTQVGPPEMGRPRDRDVGARRSPGRERHRARDGGLTGGEMETMTRAQRKRRGNAKTWTRAAAHTITLPGPLPAPGAS